jgi:NAD-dependent SIR2 family protein deacetylase
MKEIKAMPDIEHYPHIIEAAKTGRLVIFVGAGVSASVG